MLDARTNAATPQRRVLELGFVILVAATFFFSLAFFGLNIGEEGGTAFLFYRTLHGERPYIDFISGYAPGYFYWHAALLRLFGEQLMVLRLSLAALHTLITVLLFTVARRLMRGGFAVLAALAYPALLPVVPSSECSFNVAYPAWYALASMLLGWHVLRRWSRSGDAAWLLLAGLLAGLTFAFKPNSGLFQLAAAAVATALLPAAAISASRAVVFATCLVTLSGAGLIFRAHLAQREAWIFLLPLIAATLVMGMHRRGRPHGPAGRSLGAALMMLAVGFLLPTLPWMFWWFQHLGWERFAHDVLFLNTGYERFFHEAYRSPTWIDTSLAVAIAGGFVVAALARRGGLPSRVAAAVAGFSAVGLTVWLALAPMPEGFQPAVLQHVQNASFVLVLLAHWATILWFAMRIRGAHAGRALPVELALTLIGALFLLLNVYPRSDFFHLSYAMPLSLVLGFWFLDRLASVFASLPGRRSRRALSVALLAAPAVILLVAAAPQLQLSARVVAHAIGRNSGLQRLPLQRAPLLIEAGASGRRQRQLAATVQVVQTASESGDLLFTFPDLDLIGFLADRRSPTRIGYFKTGWPDHAVEAEVVDALRTQPPRLVVVENPASLFFADAPAYFFLLRDWQERDYVTRWQSGEYRVLQRRDQVDEARNQDHRLQHSLGPRPTPENHDLPTQLSIDTLHQVRASGSAEAAALVARRWSRSGFENVAAGTARFALRVVAELGDARSAVPLIEAPPSVGSELTEAWANALFQIAVRGMLAPYQFGALPEDTAFAAPLASLKQAQWQQLHAWAAAGQPVPLRFFAAWASIARTPPTSSEPWLRDLQADPNPGLRLVAATALTGNTGSAQAWREIMDQVDNAPNLIPSLALRWASLQKDVAVPLLQERLRDGAPETRVMVAYLAAVLRWEELRPVLQIAAASDRDRRVRAAAAFALGQAAGRPINPATPSSGSE